VALHVPDGPHPAPLTVTPRIVTLSESTVTVPVMSSVNHCTGVVTVIDPKL
jgi:hypothetical protein